MSIARLRERREEATQRRIEDIKAIRDDLVRRQRWECIRQSFDRITWAAYAAATFMARRARVKTDIDTVMTLRRMGMHKEANARRLSGDLAAQLQFERRMGSSITQIMRG